MATFSAIWSALSDDEVKRYGDEVRGLLARCSLVSLDAFGLSELYEGIDYAAMRRQLEADYARPRAEIEERSRRFDHARALFNGIHRFLFEEQSDVQPGVSRTQLRRECHENAYEVVRRSDAWGRLLADCFPAALRLSIHPQHPHAEKIGILLGAADDAWLTPWHGVALHVAGVEVRQATRGGGARRPPGRARRPAESFRDCRGRADRSRFREGPNMLTAPSDTLWHRRSPRRRRATPLAAVVGVHSSATWIAEHRLAVLRGFAAPPDDEMLAFCRQLGDILEWEFGAVNELARAAPTRQLSVQQPRRALPLGRRFCRARAALHLLPLPCRSRPRQRRRNDLLRRHPPARTHLLPRARRLGAHSHHLPHRKGGPLRRHLHRADDRPSSGVGPAGCCALQSRSRMSTPCICRLTAYRGRISRRSSLACIELLNDPSLCYAHAWRDNDIVLADNHALLHGRRAFRARRRAICGVSTSCSCVTMES